MDKETDRLIKRTSGFSHLRQLSREELEHVLDAHRRWVESKGAEGEKADLHEAHLEGAHLEGANLHLADVQEACFRGAHLKDADLRGATGLLEAQLGGADLTGAKLPKTILGSGGMARVDSMAKGAQKLFLAMLLGSLYAWLTIATTQDVPLLTNSISSPLPIIGTMIPIVGFYVVAPLILMCFYIYFHLYLQRLWEKMAKLPAIFPDSSTLDERVHAWLLNSFVRHHFTILKAKCPPLSRIEMHLSVLLAWWIVPVTLFLFWLRYLRRHDFVVTTLHIVLVVVSIGAGVMFQRLAAATLHGKVIEPFLLRGNRKGIRIQKGTAMVLVIGALFYLFSAGAIYGVPSWVPKAFNLIGYSPFVNLHEQDISTKPQNWTEDWAGQKAEEIYLVRGADLRGRNLRYATLSRAFLVKADLRGADLMGADLREAHLVAAKLQGAKLQRADLREAKLRARLTPHSYQFMMDANLSGADLSGANLTGIDFGGYAHLDQTNLSGVDFQAANLMTANLVGAKLDGANLQEAGLERARLKRASLQRADLQGANLDSANLEGASLHGAKGLTNEQLKKSTNWVLAFYSREFLDRLGLPPDHNERVRKKNLRGANLQGVNLGGADLQGADLRSADLSGARLNNADLQGGDLRGADLHEAILYGTDLRGADLRGANLEDADLRHSNLQRADLRAARMIGITRSSATEWKLANVYSVIDGSEARGWVPGSLSRELIDQGAVSLSSDEEWEALKKAENSDAL